MTSNPFKFLLATLVIVLLAFLPTDVIGENPPQKEKIDIRDALYDQGKESINRAININVEAFYDSSLQILEVTAFGIGDAIVYIVNPNNQVVDYFQFNSDAEPVIYLNSPVVPGIYHLVIESSNFYGIGQFEVE